MRANPFESQLERLARTLTEQVGVKVVCQGDNAWTDGQQIVLPSLPEPLNENLERMMVGYLDHEMAHVAFSDFRVAEQFAKTHPGFEGMLNVVEDALIERRAMQRWPGVRSNLDAMFAQVRDRIIQLIAQRGPFERFCTAVYLKLAHYRDMLAMEQEVAGYMDLLDRFPTVQNTHDAAALSEQLLQRWLSRRPPRSTPKPGRRASHAPQGSGQQTGRTRKDEAPGTAQQHGSGSDPAQDENPGDGGTSSRGAESDSDPADQQGSQAGTGNDGGDGADEDETATAGKSGAASEHNTPPTDGMGDGQGTGRPDLGETKGTAGTASSSALGGFSVVGQALTDAIAEAVAGLSNAAEYRVFSKRHDRIDTVAPAPDQAVDTLLATGVDVVRRLRRGLANALRSAEKRWWRDDQVRGSLSPRTLYRLCTDRRLLDVFRVRSAVQGRSTAVCAVLDASGSMTSRKMDVARQAMRVLLEALSDLKIATEAFTFTTGDRLTLAEAARVSGYECSKLQTRFSRFGNLEIGVVKQFEESVKKALTRLPTIRGSGLTPLGEAMQIAANRLITRPENRKIMVVLTDGKAGCESGDDAASQHAQRVAGRITKAGIELAGVGIQDDSLRAIVADTIVIHKLEDLPAQLCKLLGRTLKEGLSHVG